MLYFSILMLFISVFLLVYGILINLNQDKIDMEGRMRQIKAIYSEDYDEVANETFGDRILKPFYDTFVQVIVKATPIQKMAVLNKKLEKAGLLKNNTKEKWLYNKSMMALLFSSLVGVLSFLVEPNIFKAFTISFLVMLLINVCFNFFLSKRITQRKKNILRGLPYTLDLITVSVEAGLSFDGAISKVVSNIKGDLCDEFAKSLKEIRMGIERKVSLKNMAERCEVDELSTFLTSIIQADELGVSLGKVLRLEAENLREKRKQAAREQAMKAPVKMLFPLIFFIFPAIFIVILGPAVINIATMFAGGM